MCSYICLRDYVNYIYMRMNGNMKSFYRLTLPIITLRFRNVSFLLDLHECDYFGIEIREIFYDNLMPACHVSCLYSYIISINLILNYLT